MNKEDILVRVEICKNRGQGYLEVGNSRRANYYNEEIHKWEKLLSDLDLLNERKINELLEYKKGYYMQKEVIDKAIEYIDKEIYYCLSSGDNINIYLDKLLDILRDGSNE